MSVLPILKIDDKKEESFLRKKTKTVDIDNLNKKEMRDLIKKMRATMRDADGVGLSANQIGLDMSLFIAEPPIDETGTKPKFYVIINPEIVKKSGELDVMDEGCLSVPERFGPVERADKITISGFDQNGKKIKIKAWGFLARIFQHEIDHLNGKLFIDHAKKIRKRDKDK
ncbi:MAG: peptide deformylase [Candidatus Harrisonbacteria bacterium CG10_big_fil_rev_8_21_14_0_10_40_38]|uniref:Peptide deformylase n=1 Tax=Candidatus Harrisonbacteria bacterium CG10_big_fil_rev_8_21_14_0_10_40_38 TaxID=1974583 RepID=A0A2H0USP9_9BACT|nr:MAG: peptide deformylase [Candidatus Harrisonbacteria bacterium CG10_big_fil_rev_8_21_14_0_10_40_38]